jgi:zinc transport system permease protein
MAVFLARRIYDNMILGIISEDLATSTGINVARVNLAYILLVSLIVAIGIKIVGTLLVGALVIVPAATAKNVSSSLQRYLALSSILGAACSLLGVLLSYFINLPAGPLVVLSGTVIFLGAIIIKLYLEE